MKKWGIVGILPIMLGLIFFVHNPESQIEITKGIEAANRATQPVEITTDGIHNGNLLLVNHDYPVHPVSVQTDVINLFEGNVGQYFGLLDKNVRLSEEITQKFTEMVRAAKKDGVENFIISSGYRNLEEQTQLFQEMGAVYALPPGHSEHNLGLSLDVGSSKMKMNVAPEGKWIKDHAWQYGFVLRYPEDKTEITGIEYEPWHIRYVGLPHSAIMQEKNFVLEEYLQYVKEQQQLTASINGNEYTISYYPISKTTTIEVPANRQYEISGNNIDGVIVTVY